MAKSKAEKLALVAIGKQSKATEYTKEFLGKVKFESLIGANGETIIDGGYIDTQYINADRLVIGSKVTARHMGSFPRLTYDDPSDGWLGSEDALIKGFKNIIFRSGDTYYNTIDLTNYVYSTELNDWKTVQGSQGENSSGFIIDLSEDTFTSHRLVDGSWLSTGITTEVNIFYGAYNVTDSFSLSVNNTDFTINGTIVQYTGGEFASNTRPSELVEITATKDTNVVLTVNSYNATSTTGSYTIFGTTESNSTIELYDYQLNLLQTVTTSAAGTGYSFNLLGLDEGERDYVVIVTNQVGDQARLVVTLTVDTLPDTAPTPNKVGTLPTLTGTELVLTKKFSIVSLEDGSAYRLSTRQLGVSLLPNGDIPNGTTVDVKLDKIAGNTTNSIDSGTLKFYLVTNGVKGGILHSITSSSSGYSAVALSTLLNDGDTVPGGTYELMIVAEVDGSEVDSESLPIMWNAGSPYILKLSNESHTVPTDKEGAIGNYTGASTDVELYLGAENISTTATYSASTIGGTATYTVNATTGSVIVSVLTTDVATIEISAVVDGSVVAKGVFSLAKSKAGLDGAAGNAYRLSMSPNVLNLGAGDNSMSVNVSARVLVSPHDGSDILKSTAADYAEYTSAEVRIYNGTSTNPSYTLDLKTSTYKTITSYKGVVYRCELYINGVYRDEVTVLTSKDGTSSDIAGADGTDGNSFTPITKDWGNVYQGDDGILYMVSSNARFYLDNSANNTPVPGSSATATYWLNSYFQTATGRAAIQGDGILFTSSATIAAHQWTAIFKRGATYWEDDTRLVVNGSMIVNGTVALERLAFLGTKDGSNNSIYYDSVNDRLTMGDIVADSISAENIVIGNTTNTGNTVEIDGSGLRIKEGTLKITSSTMTSVTDTDDTEITRNAVFGNKYTTDDGIAIYSGGTGRGSANSGACLHMFNNNTDAAFAVTLTSLISDTSNGASGMLISMTSPTKVGLNVNGIVHATGGFTEFTGVHRGELVHSCKVGDILEDIVGEVVIKGISDISTKVTATKSNKSKIVFGVASSFLGNSDVYINALGDGAINVCSQNGDIEVGDYICSSDVRGKGMKQDDDLMHNYTVAKARESVVWGELEEYEELDGYKWTQVACTYHCG